MLQTCPECELPVSDKAITCPHCGYPLIPSKKNRTCKPRRMRLPNGFGRITKITSKNLRKPYRAMVTVGHDEKGNPIGRLLQPQAYFETYNEAYAALVEYNRNPYDLDRNITMRELWDEWSEKYKATVSEAGYKGTMYAWRRCGELYDIKVRELRVRHIKGVLDGGGVAPSTKTRIKTLLNKMLDHAVEYEVVDKNVARTFILPEEVSKTKTRPAHIAFTEKELQTLWLNKEVPYVNIILFQCYMGWRPQELGLIRLDNVDLKHWTIRGGMKTEAGMNRLVPVHPLIRPIVESFFHEAVSLHSDKLINYANKRTHKRNTDLIYDTYKKTFYRIMSDLNISLEHRPHDCRKTFVTLCKRYEVDEYAIKYMVGHTIKDITEGVYTDRGEDITWLHKEIGRIPEDPFS